MDTYDVIIVGGGASGMLAAAVLAETPPQRRVLILEKSSRTLEKVRLSGGGRCNLTHRCSDIRAFVQNYPRGGNELIGPFHRFGPGETMAWFEEHGVPLVTLDDGCVFPLSDTAEDIIQALQRVAASGHVQIRQNSNVTGIRQTSGGYIVDVSNAPFATCCKLLITTGGGSFIDGTSHTIEPCVPSLFAFSTTDREFTALAGIVKEDVQLSVDGLTANGALLITHSGVSGPAALCLSSFGARLLAGNGYHFIMNINWSPSQNEETILAMLNEMSGVSPRKQVGTWPPAGIPARLWKLLLKRACVIETCEWAGCSLKSRRQIVKQLNRFTLSIRGKSRHLEEFVTCGGIRLKEVSFQTLESRLHPGLYFAGEVLDIDALTGGFNLQAAWTTGFLAAKAMQKALA